MCIGPVGVARYLKETTVHARAHGKKNNILYIVFFFAWTRQVYRASQASTRSALRPPQTMTGTMCHRLGLAPTAAANGAKFLL